MKQASNESCIHYERYSNTPSKVAKQLYLYLQWSGKFICKKDFYINRHGLKSILLLHTIKGSGILEYNDTIITLQPNSYFLIDCIEPHIYFPKTNDWEFRFLHFSGKGSIELYRHIISLNGGHSFTINAALKRLITNCLEISKAQNSIIKETEISKILNDILYEIIFSLQGSKNMMNNVCSFIKENYSENFTTEDLAEKFGFSRSYFATEFKKNTGTTLHDYILCNKINIAKTLLNEDKYSISQIAERLGFNDDGTFIRAFKRKEKITPLQYKKNGYFK